MSGTIPSELGNANLRQLSLSENRLSGTIPSELGDLASLTVLNLGDNELNGSIPSALGALTNLAELSLASNQLNGEIPPELGNLTNLGLLRLAGNRLSGCVPEAWRNIEENDIDSWDLPFCVNTETRAGSGVLACGLAVRRGARCVPRLRHPRQSQRRSPPSKSSNRFRRRLPS